MLKTDIEVVEDKLEMEQETMDLQIVRNKNGLPVIMGWEGFDAVKAIQEMREEYEDHLAGVHRK
jgi:hypothetical protein